MSAMTKVALPAQTWTLVHTAGGTNVAINLHSNVEIFLYVGSSAPSDLSGAFVVMHHPAQPFTVDTGDKVYLYNNSTAASAVTVWA